MKKGPEGKADIKSVRTQRKTAFVRPKNLGGASVYYEPILEMLKK
jgi:hypothetical protein